MTSGAGDSSPDRTRRSARCWRLTRRDGTLLGFTDHDRDLEFEGVRFRAGTGLDTAAVEARTGLSVDNSEIVGALDDEALSETDILSGRLDGAAISVWDVDWSAPQSRRLVFEGQLGEIRRKDGAFEVDLRSLVDLLNRPRGRVFSRSCGAILGDRSCGVDLNTPAFRSEVTLVAVSGTAELVVAGAVEYADGWFAAGECCVLEGPGAGLAVGIREDRRIEGGRRLRIWREPCPALAHAARLRLSAGCDKRAMTCREKFQNFMNFRGFPHIPGEDWLISVPREGMILDGGRMPR